METLVLIHPELVLKPVETNGFASQDTCPVLNEVLDLFSMKTWNLSPMKNKDLLSIKNRTML